MLNINEINHETMTVEECWERYGWGSEAKPNSTVIHAFVDVVEIFVDELADESYGGKYGCEIFDANEDMVGQWFADDIDDAIRGAFVDYVGYRTMAEEDNCEDATNCIARESYVRMFGECPIYEMDIEQYDALLPHAMAYVKSHVKWFDYEWEEF